MLTTAEFLALCEAEPRRVEAALAALCFSHGGDGPCPPPYLADYSIAGAMMMALPTFWPRTRGVNTPTRGDSGRATILASHAWGEHQSLGAVMTQRPNRLVMWRNKCRGQRLKFAPQVQGQKQASAKAPFGGPAREPNERRDLVTSYVCREAKDLCRDGLTRFPSPGLLESRPRRLTPTPCLGRDGRESSS